MRASVQELELRLEAARGALLRAQKALWHAERDLEDAHLRQWAEERVLLPILEEETARQQLLKTLPPPILAMPAAPPAIQAVDWSDGETRIGTPPPRPPAPMHIHIEVSGPRDIDPREPETMDQEIDGSSTWYEEIVQQSERMERPGT